MQHINSIQIEGNDNIIIHDVHGSHIYINSNEGIQKMLLEQRQHINEILLFLQNAQDKALQALGQRIQHAETIFNIANVHTLNYYEEGKGKTSTFPTDVVFCWVISTTAGKVGKKKALQPHYHATDCTAWLPFAGQGTIAQLLQEYAERSKVTLNIRYLENEPLQQDEHEAFGSNIWIG